MNKENMPIIKKENFFLIIKNFVISIFKPNNKENDINIIQNEIIISEKQEKNFLEDIKIQKDKEKEQLLSIQKEIESGDLSDIDIYDKINKMQPEQVNKLKSLYNEQIIELKNELQSYKDKIIEVRGKMKTSN